MLVFHFFREVLHAGVNFPGRSYDRKLASLSGSIYPKLDDSITPPGYDIMGDSAFVCSMGFAGGKIVRACNRNETSGIQLSSALVSVY